MMRSTKFQAPNTKQISLPAGRQESPKFENLNKTVSIIWIWSLGIIWDLGFGIWNFVER